LNRNHLELFKVVAEKKSFSKASDSLHISQPAISQQISVLEEQLGVKLFERTTRRIALTEAGKLLYQYAIQICNLFTEAGQCLCEYSKTARESLTIGASLTIGEYLLPKIIGGFKELFPQLPISIVVCNTHAIVQNLLTQTVDVGLVEDPVNTSELCVKPFMDDEFGLIVHPNHPLVNQRLVTLEQLTCFPFVLREKGSDFRQVIEKALVKAGWAPENLAVKLELGSTEAVKAAVEANLGVSIISQWTVQKELRLNLLKLLSIDGLHICRKFYVAYNPQKRNSQLTERFLAFILSENT